MATVEANTGKYGRADPKEPTVFRPAGYAKVMQSNNNHRATLAWLYKIFYILYNSSLQLISLFGLWEETRPVPSGDRPQDYER